MPDETRSEDENKKRSLIEDEKALSRRAYLMAAGGVAAVAVIGGVAYYLSLPGPSPTPGPTPTPTPVGPTPTPTPTPIPPRPTMKYFGHAFWFPPEAEAKWEELKNQPIESTYGELYIICQRQIEDPGAWDLGGGGRYRPVIDANILRPMPIEKIPRWKADKVLDMFNNPGDYFSDAMATRFSELLWHEVGTSLIAVPIMWNFDSLTYLPENVPYEEAGGQKTSFSYSEVWNTEWKGRTACQDEAFTTFSETANELEATGQAGPYENFTNMPPSEVDEIFNYLLPIVQSGQIRTFWFNYADVVLLLSTKEIYMASTYQPTCFDVRKAGVPAYYARLANGPFFWYNSHYASSKCTEEMFEYVCEISNWCLEQWMQMLYTKQGYPSPAMGWEDYVEGMGKEMFDWFFNGKATYLSIADVMEEIWPDNPEFAALPERLQNALFLPDVYFKHFWLGQPPRTGTPNPNGNLRDIGSNEEKQAITRYYLSPDLPDNNDYYVTKWEELKANIPT